MRRKSAAPRSVVAETARVNSALLRRGEQRRGRGTRGAEGETTRVPSSVRRGGRGEKEEKSEEGRGREEGGEGGGRWAREEETEGKKYIEEERNRAREEGGGEGASQECVGPSARVSSHPVFGVALYCDTFTCMRAR